MSSPKEHHSKKILKKLAEKPAISIEDLKDKEKLYLHLATWAIGMPTRHEIQHFVEALQAAAESATTEAHA